MKFKNGDKVWYLAGPPDWCPPEEKGKKLLGVVIGEDKGNGRTMIDLDEGATIVSTGLLRPKR